MCLEYNTNNTCTRAHMKTTVYNILTGVSFNSWSKTWINMWSAVAIWATFSLSLPPPNENMWEIYHDIIYIWKKRNTLKNDLWLRCISLPRMEGIIRYDSPAYTPHNEYNDRQRERDNETPPYNAHRTGITVFDLDSKISVRNCRTISISSCWMSGIVMSKSAVRCI